MSKNAKIAVLLGLFAAPILGVLLSDSVVAKPEAEKSIVTHMGQPLENFVVLSYQSLGAPATVCSSILQERDFFRVFPDGTLDTVPFVVPEGQSLVVTDVDWRARENPSNPDTLDTDHNLSVSIRLDDNTNGPTVFWSSTFRIEIDDDGSSYGRSENLTSGFIVGAGIDICPRAASVGPTGNGVSQSVNAMVLRGYLIQN